MFGIAERHREKRELKAALRSSLDETVSEILRSDVELTLYVSDRRVIGNRNSFSIELDVDHGRGFLGHDAENSQRKYGDRFKKSSISLAGSIRIAPFAEAVGLDFSRSYAADSKGLYERFDTCEQLVAWLDSPEARDVMISHAWITFWWE